MKTALKVFFKGDLDQAVIDRVDESIEFGLPDVDERKKLMRMYYDKYVNPDTTLHKGDGKSGKKVEKNEEKDVGLQMKYTRFECIFSPSLTVLCIPWLSWQLVFLAGKFRKCSLRCRPTCMPWVKRLVKDRVK